ncbi:MAG: S8 family peptidase [Sandaracinaceae bacterium]
MVSVWMRTDPAPSASLAARVAPPAADPWTGAVLVDVDDDASAEVLRALGERVASAIAPYAWPAGASALGDELSDPANLFRLEPPPSEVPDILRELRGQEGVEVVERERTWSVPEGAGRLVASPARGGAVPAPQDGEGFVPNDPYYRHQWHLDQIGMPRAWQQARGAGAVVAVVDTGVAHRSGGRFHRAPDLAQTELVPGWDFVHNDPHPDDEHGHGTHVAGTIAQSTNNGLGVAGVAPAAAIMPLQVLDRHGSGGWGAIAAAIRYAADHGADVINMSLGGGFPSGSVQRAIAYAHGKGVLVVAAAGNSGRSRVDYPARHDHVLSVGAVRYDRELTFYSNYGKGLDIVAPGGDLRVDQNGDGLPDGVIQNTIVRGDPTSFDYLAWQGTSMASPHVAGVAALVYGAGVRDPDAVERILRTSAADLDDQERYADGLVQADGALRLASQGSAAGRAAVAGLLVLLLGVGLRRRLGVSLAVVGPVALLVAGAAGVLPWHLVGAGGHGSSLALGPLGLSALAAGPTLGLLVLSVLPFFGLVALTLSLEGFRGPLVGVGLGMAAFLTVEALWPTLRVGLVPELLVGPWLLASATATFLLALLVARRG